ncbi:MAG: hypothetical protein KIT41_14295 [Pyrinomonadaceae bacterium]|nr:hypothetical protein [Pyrinomonadaceae bacterium]
MKKQLIQHSSESNEHYTPVEIVEAAREWMGGIGLDPCSSEIANRTVRSEQILTSEDLSEHFNWSEILDRGIHRSLFVNPPGKGSMDPDVMKGLGSKAADVCWLRKTIETVQAGDLATMAVFVGYSIDILQKMQGAGLNPFDYHLCVPRRRVSYGAWDGEAVRAQNSPPNASVIIGLANFRFVDGGPRFKRCFKGIGAVHTR